MSLNYLSHQDRDTRYQLRQDWEHEQEQRRTNEQRHSVYVKTPELDAVRDRMADLNRQEVSLDEWIVEVSRLAAAWRQGNWGEQGIEDLFGQQIAALKMKREGVREAWKLAWGEFQKLGG